MTRVETDTKHAISFTGRDDSRLQVEYSSEGQGLVVVNQELHYTDLTMGQAEKLGHKLLGWCASHQSKLA